MYILLNPSVHYLYILQLYIIPLTINLQIVPKNNNLEFIILLRRFLACEPSFPVGAKVKEEMGAGLWPRSRRFFHSPATLFRQALDFPCLDRNAAREQSLPEDPVYDRVVTGFQTFHNASPFPTLLGGKLPSFDIAYESWGEINADKSNVVLLHTGLSASSHARSPRLVGAFHWIRKAY